MKKQSTHQGVGVIIDTGGGLLLQKRDNKPGIMWPDSISCWGGAVETSDISPISAASRELKEELGIEEDEITLLPLVNTSLEYLDIHGMLQTGEFHFYIGYLNDPKRFLHVYEGVEAIEIPYDFELSSLHTSFSPNAITALEAFAGKRNYEAQT